MIYTPQNALGSLCVDVLNGKYIHQVIEVDTEASTVTVIDSPARIENDQLVVKKLQFDSIVAVDREGYMPVLFLCKKLARGGYVSGDKLQLIGTEKG